MLSDYDRFRDAAVRRRVRGAVVGQRPAKIRLVKDDEWGGLYRDEPGFAYRTPGYRKRWESLPPSWRSDWVPLKDGWFRSVKRAYKKTIIERLTEATKEVLSPIVDPILRPLKSRLLWLAVGGGVAIYLAARYRPGVLSRKR